ncbi:MAG: bifunctional DNA-binding transcriptional regulator/O6-methylguanine-DNA methyltransferase Ada [bacterium]|nr:bifunctional DNA-binding transcriptional regulator/O6-methylguanine-DNA methyltransferase Ada [bacterium]
MIEMAEMNVMTNPMPPLANAELNDDGRWQAVLMRDGQYDGAFYTAVRTTGVYCRPSCKARTPKRENVRFFETPQEAEAAGFRACKRCRPLEVDAHAALAQSVARYIEEHLDETITLDMLGAAMHVSPFHLQRVFKRVMGVSPRQYGEAVRLERLKQSLKECSSVTAAIYDAGYNASSRVYEHTGLGMTPGEYRRGAAEKTIRYTIADTALGRLLVAATERGICRVTLRNDDEMIEALLVKEFSNAEFVRADEDSDMADWVTQIVAHLAGRHPHLDLPLDIRATAFQQQVWHALMTIPYGTTQSYTDIAEAIGNPKAVRAVANACARNPVPLIIPCHRVIREDGSLGGYALGIDRKQTILENERRTAEEGAK